MNNYTIDDITICIVSFIRFDKLRECIVSIRRYYPRLPIIVVDNSGQSADGNADFEWCLHAPNTTVHRLPFDIGVSQCRNYAVDQVQTKLALVIDDDTVFTRWSRIELMLDVLNHTGEDCLVSGMCAFPGSSLFAWLGKISYNYEHNAVYSQNLTFDKGLQTSNGVIYYETTWFSNFLLASVKFFKRNRWHPKYKMLGDHLYHVLEIARNKDKVYVVPSCVFVNNNFGSTEEYNAYRARGKEEQLDSIKGDFGYSQIKTPDRHHALFFFNREYLSEKHYRNLIIFNVYKSGSSTLSRIFNALGWWTGEADQWNEPLKVTDINKRLTGQLPGHVGPTEIPDEVATWKEPWVIKDPKFSYTLDHWLPYIEKFKPTLILIRRDPKVVFQTMLSRGWIRMGKYHEVEHMIHAAEENYKRWPWDKIVIRWEDVFPSLYEVKKKMDIKDEASTIPSAS